MQVRTYELYYDDKHLGNFTVEELSNQFGIAPANVYKYANEGTLYKKHYTWKVSPDKAESNSKISNMSAADRKLMKEWDEVTAVFKRRAKARRERLCS